MEHLKAAMLQFQADYWDDTERKGRNTGICPGCLPYTIPSRRKAKISNFLDILTQKLAKGFHSLYCEQE